MLFFKPYRKLYIVGDNAEWAIDVEARALKRIMESMGVPTKIVKRVPFDFPRTVHYVSQFSLNDRAIYKKRHRISVDYFHGKPEQGENFKRCFESLKKNHKKITRIRVSTREMEEVIKASGIDPTKVVRIPIGIDTDSFKPRNESDKAKAREKLGIPQDAVVIGSFQKDGVGWEEGLEPKLIKGPDVFLKAVAEIKKEVPNLWVLLSGPARGYVMKGLDELSIPYRHVYAKEYEEIASLYDALDLYIIASREEGGPKACLESMAKGVPLVTTQVGQCADLVRTGVNAMMVPIEDAQGLARESLQVLTNQELRHRLIEGGLSTARENNYTTQSSVWKTYFENLIASSPHSSA